MSEDITVNLKEKEEVNVDLQEGESFSVDFDQAANETDTRVDVSEDGTTIVSRATDINFRDNANVIDDGDGSVTIDLIADAAAPTIQDDGVDVETTPTQLNFAGADFDVTNPVDNQVKILFTHDDLTIAGNNVALGGSTAIDHSDLSNIGASDHHARYTDEEAQDVVWNNFSTGSNLSFTYDDANDSASLSISGSLYTDEDAQDAVGNAFTVSGDGSFVYDDTNDELELTIDAPVDSVAGKTGTVILSTDDVSEGSNLYFTDERAQDAVNAALVGGTNVTKTYDDANDTITLDAADQAVDVSQNGSLVTSETSDINFTVSNDADLSVADDGDGTTTVSVDTTVPVDSVAGKTGAVTLSTDDVSEGNNLYYTDERAQDALNDALVAGTNLTKTYDDANDTLTLDATDTNTQLSEEEVQDFAWNVLTGTQTLIDVVYDDANDSVDFEVQESSIDHDVLTNYVANEHIDHSTVSITGGNALTGGGDLTASRSLAVATDGIQTDEIDQSIAPVWTGQHTFDGGLDAGGNRITSIADPTGAQDAATKAYADSIAQGVTVKDSVRAASTTNIDLASSTDPNPVDGVNLNDGDRVLLKNQTDATENGIYVAQTSTDPTTWIRSDDADEDSEVSSGIFVFVEQGTENGDTSYILTTEDPITLGTTSLTWTIFSRAGEIVAGDGLSKNGNTIDARLDIDDSGANRTGAFGIDFNNLLEVIDDGDNTVTVNVEEDNISHDGIDQTTVSSDDHHARYTDEEAQDAALSIVSGSTDVGFNYNDAGDSATISLTGLTQFSTDDLSEGSNLYYTDERAQDAVFNNISTGSNLSFTYDDADDSANLSLVGSLYSDEDAQDAVGNSVVASGDLDYTYDDANNQLEFSVTTTTDTRTDISEAGTTVVSETEDINVTTSNDASASVTADGDGSATLNISTTVPVDSVNGQTGALTLDTDDVSEGASNLYFTDERAQDAVGTISSGGNAVTVNYDDASNTITTSVDSNSIGNDELANTESFTVGGLTSNGDIDINESTLRLGDGDGSDILMRDLGTPPASDYRIVNGAGNLAIRENGNDRMTFVSGGPLQIKNVNLSMVGQAINDNTGSLTLQSSKNNIEIPSTNIIEDENANRRIRIAGRNTSVFDDADQNSLFLDSSLTRISIQNGKTFDVFDGPQNGKGLEYVPSSDGTSPGVLKTPNANMDLGSNNISNVSTLEADRVEGGQFKRGEYAPDRQKVMQLSDDTADSIDGQSRPLVFVTAPTKAGVFRVGFDNMNRLDSGSSFNVVGGNTTLTGTTGPDGSINLSVNDNTMYVENRTGGDETIRIHARQ